MNLDTNLIASKINKDHRSKYTVKNIKLQDSTEK